MSASAAPPLRPGEVIGKQVEIEAGLGSGPAGASYTAKSAGQRVVVKMLHGPAADQATRDRLFERLKKPVSDALVNLIEFGEHDGRGYAVMDFVEGESLRKLMDDFAAQKKAFGVQEACQIVTRVLEAADAAHRQGIVHRHLKPGNVIVQSKVVGPGKVMRTVRVTGLGLSELVHPGVLAENLLDRPDSRYLAPELSSPAAGGTPQADVYSAGVIFYELLTGQTPMGTYLAPSQIRDDLPKHVDDIVDIALAANAEERYPSARDMMNDIQRVFAEDAPVQTAVPRKALVGVLGGVIGLAILSAVAVKVFDPQAAAVRKDEALRATIVKENPLPDENTVRAKVSAHPDMVYIPAGSYLSGRLHGESQKVAGATEPLAAVKKLPAYFVNRFEGEDVKGGNPSVNATYDQAEAACAASGKRLCTADEWERACKGPEMLTYGYGDVFDPARCGPDIAKDADKDNRSDLASGALDGCTNKFGVYDMAGGAREWTSTEATSGTTFRIIKGGKAGSPERGSRCAYADTKRTDLTDRFMTWRCCLGENEVITPPADPAVPPGAAPTGAAPTGAAPPPP